MSDYKKVYPIQSEGDWYVLPIELKEQFFNDEQNEEMVESGEFSEKYAKYATGGDLNLFDFYGEIEP